MIFILIYFVFDVHVDSSQTRLPYSFISFLWQIVCIIDIYRHQLLSAINSFIVIFCTLFLWMICFFFCLMNCVREHLKRVHKSLFVQFMCSFWSHWADFDIWLQHYRSWIMLQIEFKMLAFKYVRIWKLH